MAFLKPMDTMEDGSSASFVASTSALCDENEHMSDGTMSDKMLVDEVASTGRMFNSAPQTACDELSEFEGFEESMPSSEVYICLWFSCVLMSHLAHDSTPGRTCTMFL